MRKAQKRQALDFVKLLGQAHDTVKKNIEKREATQAMEIGRASCRERVFGLV